MFSKYAIVVMFYNNEGLWVKRRAVSVRAKWIVHIKQEKAIHL